MIFVSNAMTNLNSYLHFCFLLGSYSCSVSLHGSYTQGHEALLAQVKGSRKDIRGLQLAVSGDLRHSMTNLAFLPSALGLDGALGQSDTLIEGRGSCRNVDYTIIILIIVESTETTGLMSKRHEFRILGIRFIYFLCSMKLSKLAKNLELAPVDI